MPSNPPDTYATVPLGHHVLRQDRAEQLRRRPGRKSGRPECFVLGHAWSADGEREGWLICIACEAVQQD